MLLQLCGCFFTKNIVLTLQHQVIAALELTVLEEDVDKCGLKDSELILGDSSAAALSKAATAATVAELEATAAAAGGESEWEGGGRAAERAKQAALIQQQQQREIKAVEAVLKRESSGGDKYGCRFENMNVSEFIFHMTLLCWGEYQFLKHVSSSFVHNLSFLSIFMSITIDGDL